MTDPQPHRSREERRSSGGTSLGEFTVIVAVAVAVAIATAMWMRRSAPSVEPMGGLAPGRQAPEVTAPFWLNGRPEPQAGRVRVIHGWFPACPHCATEAPELVALRKKFGDRVQFIGLSPWGDDEREAHEDFVERFGLDWPNGYGATDALRAFESSQYFPAAWVVDGRGKVVWNSDSEARGESLEEGIERALSSGA